MSKKQKYENRHEDTASLVKSTITSEIREIKRGLNSNSVNTKITLLKRKYSDDTGALKYTGTKTNLISMFHYLRK